MALLEANGLCKAFATGRRRRRLVHRAVDDVSLSIATGRTLAIVGESGAGKSTLARLVLRLVEPDAGTVVLDGADIGGLSAAELREKRQHMQMIFQDPYSCFDPRVPIGRSVGEPLKVHRRGDARQQAAKVAELLDRVGLGAHLSSRYPRQLSGGQLQRASIARALTLDPKLLVCDEAVAALDVSIRAQVLNLLLDLQEERGLAYLFVAHDLGIVRSFAHDVLVMRDGRVVEAGPVSEVLARPAAPYTRELLDSEPKPDPSRRTQRRGAQAATGG